MSEDHVHNLVFHLTGELASDVYSRDAANHRIREIARCGINIQQHLMNEMLCLSESDQELNRRFTARVIDHLVEMDLTLSTRLTLSYLLIGMVDGATYKQLFGAGGPMAFDPQHLEDLPNSYVPFFDGPLVTKDPSSAKAYLEIFEGSTMIANTIRQRFVDLEPSVAGAILEVPWIARSLSYQVLNVSLQQISNPVVYAFAVDNHLIQLNSSSAVLARYPSRDGAILRKVARTIVDLLDAEGQLPLAKTAREMTDAAVSQMKALGRSDDDVSLLKLVMLEETVKGPSRLREVYDSPSP
ncbi:hypothetical protein HNP46_006495 [Pseudomonas nitritireducens]|uniref:Uncharacterized protein n=1 Tax=Pseudomonas nitroreducens TaxID=46680 RepID=A0A7W7KRM2_PSENT|nr:hypothetical protein [Pseudomonas nitritireducens]MBB4867581.1 hypothetical protein [Pseudomonas nitritireducens]